MESTRGALLLVNLGTPAAPTAPAVRAYLAEFLSDPRVVKLPRWLWLPILYGVVLRTRPAKSAEKYAQIWTPEGSPLAVNTVRQAALLQEKLGIPVKYAMRYGRPAVSDVVKTLENPLVVPLYPQYAAATTATVADKAFDALKTMRWQPAVRIAPPWHDDPVYIEAVAGSLEAELSKLSFKPDVILASFHGVPRDYLLQGDPYYCQCHKTARLLRARLGLSEDRFMLTFQSRFGNAEWLQPYTDMTVKSLAERGVKNLAIVTPGFAADCLETLEEIAGENAEIFHHHGGKNFAAIPCLNDSEPGMAVIAHVVRRELKGWIDG